jgi:hypothetical protein
MRATACLLTVWCLGGSVAAARDIAVNNVDGAEVRTVSAALRLAASGDRIVLANTGRPYRESISLVGSRLSGSSLSPLVLVGNGAILDGSAPVPTDAWEHYENLVFRFRPPVAGNQQLFVAGRPVPYVPASPQTNLPPKLKPLQWSLVEGLIYFSVEASKLPSQYDVTYAAQQTGITLYHVEHVVIMDLVVQGFRIDGIQAANSARGIQFINVTCRGNGRAGIAVGGASQVAIERCTIGDNRTAQLLTLPLGETHVYQSELLPLTAPAWVDQGGRFFLGAKQIEGGLREIRAEQRGQ